MNENDISIMYKGYLVEFDTNNDVWNLYEDNSITCSDVNLATIKEYINKLNKNKNKQ